MSYVRSMGVWWVFVMEDEMKTRWKCGGTLDVYEKEGEKYTVEEIAEWGFLT